MGTATGTRMRPLSYQGPGVPEFRTEVTEKVLLYINGHLPQTQLLLGDSTILRVPARTRRGPSAAPAPAPDPGPRRRQMAERGASPLSILPPPPRVPSHPAGLSELGPSGCSSLSTLAQPGRSLPCSGPDASADPAPGGGGTALTLNPRRRCGRQASPSSVLFSPGQGA